jgi:adenylate cyclase
LSQGERRLAAIMFTDLQGYTSLAQESEADAMRTLDAYRGLMRPIISRFGGREVKTMGDGSLVEFTSALEAAECAVEIQKAVHEHNRTTGARMTVRVGIHVGDVIHREGDVLGDAVNVASRIEPLAHGGGVCITGQVYYQVRNKVEYELVRLDIQELKNVSIPTEVYRIKMPWEEETPKALDMPDRRLAVLPLDNISPDPNDAYFADGLHDELITALSKVGGLEVIARTSVLRYKGGAKQIATIGRELNVGSVLEGSVRKAGNRIRVTAQLIKAANEAHVWAETYDRELVDIFEVQSDIAGKVAGSLRVQLTPQERVILSKKQTANPEAHALYMRGRFFWNERNKDGNKKALDYFQKAAGLDPQFALAYSGIADCYNIMVDYAWMDPAVAYPLAKDNALKAIQIDDSLAEAHASLALAIGNEWDFSAVEKEFKRALELRPSYAMAYHWYALMLMATLRPEDAYVQELKGLEIDPYSRLHELGVSITLYLMGRYPEAKVRLGHLEEMYPEFAPASYWLSVILVPLGERDEAVMEAERAMKFDQSTNVEINLAGTYALAGRSEDAVRTLEKVRNRGANEPVSLTQLGITEILIGRSDDGFEHLDEAVDKREIGILYIRGDRFLAPYLKDPRWDRTREKIEKVLAR